MRDTINSARYPRTTGYISKLPQGLDSYPDCLVKTDSHDGLREKFAAIAEDKDLPSDIRQFFLGDIKDTWIPEVLGSTIVHLVREYGFTSDEAYRAWSYENNAKLFKKPHYKVLMYLFSPTLLASNGAKRWEAIHKGSTLVTESIEKKDPFIIVKSRIDFPENVFDDLDMINVSSGFKAAIDASRAKNAEITKSEISATTGIIEMRWES